MEEKLSENRDLNINIELGNATDLSKYENESFDTVFCFGPMYHLKTQQERTKCARECLRVLKKGGIFALAYINKLFIATMFVKHNKESFFFQVKWRYLWMDLILIK